MRYILFLALAICGFLVSYFVLKGYHLDIFAENVFGFTLPTTALVCLIALSIPFYFAERRLNISVMASKLLPFCYGLFVLPGLLLGSLFPIAHESIWVAGFRASAIGTTISFCIA
jgi:hypothetical protein